MVKMMAVQVHDASPDCETIIDEKLPQGSTDQFESIKLHAVHLPHESKAQVLPKFKQLSIAS